jgi:oligoendopeptidase F
MSTQATATKELQTEWQLEKYLYSGFDDPQLKADKEEIQQLVDEIGSEFKGKLSEGMLSTMEAYFQKDERLTYLAEKGVVFHHLLSTKYTDDTEIQKHYSEYEGMLTDISNRLLFVDQEFKELGVDRLGELMEEESLKPHYNYLFQKRQNLKYLLSEEAEKVVNIKDFAGSSVVTRLRSNFTANFSFPVELNGKIEEKTEEEVRSMRMDADPEVRKASYKALETVYGDKSNQIVLGSLYKSVIRNWTGMQKLRGMDHVMSPRNISEEQEDAVVDLLLDTVRENFPIVQRYLKLKARAMGKDVLDYTDRFAPIGESSTEIPYEEAAKLFLETIATFDQEFADFSHDMITGGRIDVYPRKGKRGGAYAYYGKDIKGSVFLNYTGKMYDVTTLAHELGHATHGYFSQQQAYTVYDTSLSLAETASVFNETLFAEAFVKTLESPQDRIVFLEDNISGVMSTIFRQIMFVLFERDVHQQIASGKDLSEKEFTEIWRTYEREIYADTLSYPDDYKATVWAQISHFFRPFYCYSYAFGNILSFSLYQQYKEKGQDFVEDYKNILRAGGSMPAKELLAQYDIDITQKKFFTDGLQVVTDMLDQFEDAIVEMGK